MKKFLVPVVAALGAITMLAAPAAQAEPVDDYFAQLNSAGFVVDSTNRDKAMIIGLGLCVDLLSGIPASDEVAELVKAGFSTKQATTWLKIAQKNLCPKSLQGAYV